MPRHGSKAQTVVRLFGHLKLAGCRSFRGIERSRCAVCRAGRNTLTKVLFGSETSQTALAAGRGKYHRAKGQVCARMGLPPRSLAADAHHCIMVRSRCRIYRIQGRGARSLRPPLGRLASDRLVFARCWRNEHPRGKPDEPEPAAVLGSVKEWPGNDLRVGDLARRPSLTDPRARRS
jgi:hypothetical protein